jgi:hypothetical protein
VNLLEAGFTLLPAVSDNGQIRSVWSDGSILHRLIQLMFSFSCIRLSLATISQRLERSSLLPDGGHTRFGRAHSAALGEA